MDIPDRAQVDPVAPYDTFVEMFLESLKRASPHLFVPGVPAATSTVLGTTEPVVSPAKVVSALSLQFQNEYLATSDQRHFNSVEFHDCVSTGLDVIRRYVDLENFLTVTLKALKLFRPVVMEASIELDNSLLDFVDAIKRIEARGEVQPYEILTEISENIPTLKRQADKAYRVVKAAFKRANDTLDAEKAAKRQAQGSKSNIDPAVMEMMRESFQAYHHFQSNGRGNNNHLTQSGERNSNNDQFQRPRPHVQQRPFQQQQQHQMQYRQQQQQPQQQQQHNPQQHNQQFWGHQPGGQNQMATSPQEGWHKALVDEAAAILRQNFPAAPTGQLYRTMRTLIMSDRKCLACRGDMQQTNGRLTCIVDCTRPGLHPDNKNKLQTCTSLQ